MWSRAIAVVALACAMPALADDQTRLKVEVLSQTGKPVDRAAVIVQFVEGRSVVKLGKKIQTRWEVRTNQEGMAKVPSMPEGKIRIQVIAKGYQTFGDAFEIQGEEQVIQVKLNPPQPQFSAHQ